MNQSTDNLFDDISEFDLKDETINVRRKRNTTALYSDNLRFLIIDAIARRPILWDSKSREPLSLVQRKQSFAEIAESLSTDDVPLEGPDVEKQWKNLKDTYYKVKRKMMQTNGSISRISPKWKFFNSLLFIDQMDENGGKESSPAEIEEEVPLSRKRKSAPTAVKLDAKKPGHIRSTVLEPADNKTSSCNVTSSPMYVVEEEDEYSNFCRYLNRQLREIGTASRKEFLTVQKRINDIVFDAQIRLSDSSSLPNATHESIAKSEWSDC